MEKRELSQKEKEFFDKIKLEKKYDPLAGVKYGSADVYESLRKLCSNENNQTNMHNFLLYSAGLAGYACQAAPLFKLVMKEKQDPKSVFKFVMTADGEKFLFGDSINEYLLKGSHSVYGYVAGAYKELCPGKEVPDITEIVKKVAQGIGDNNYRVCGEVSTRELRDTYALLWKNIFTKMTRYCQNPIEWPVLYGMVLGKAMLNTKGLVDPDMAFNFVMEAAVCASKMDLTAVNMG